MRTAKAQISLRIRAVWSWPSLSVNRSICHYRMHQWKANARMRLWACVGWIWICVFCACSNIHFRLARPNCSSSVQVQILHNSSFVSASPCLNKCGKILSNYSLPFKSYDHFRCHVFWSGRYHFWPGRWRPSAISMVSHVWHLVNPFTRPCGYQAMYEKRIKVFLTVPDLCPYLLTGHGRTDSQVF